MINKLSPEECIDRKKEIADLFNQSFSFVSSNNNWTPKEIKSKICYSQKYPPYASILLAQNPEKKLIGLISIKVVDIVKLHQDLKHALKKAGYNKKFIRVINWLIVDKKYQKQKIGTELLSAVENIPYKYSDYGIGLSCKKDIMPFYKKNGFKFLFSANDKKFGEFQYMIKF